MSDDVLAKALAEMPMPAYGVGTAWETEECPFCAWRGEADAYTPAEEQGHAESCPVRVARLVIGLPAPVGQFTREHRVGRGQNTNSLEQTERGPRYMEIYAECETCGYRGAVRRKDEPDGWEQSGAEIQAHRAATRVEADGMGPNDEYHGIKRPADA